MPTSIHADRAGGIQKLLLCLGVAVLAVTPAAWAEPTVGESDATASPRQLYNDGTRKLREGKIGR